MNYKFKNSAGSWRKGDIVTEKDIAESNLGGLERLRSLDAIEETTEPACIQTEAANTPNNTKGDNVDPGSDDTVETRAGRRAEAVGAANDGTKATGDSAAVTPSGRPGKVKEVTPVGGRPGTVIRTTTNPPKNA